MRPKFLCGLWKRYFDDEKLCVGFECGEIEFAVLGDFDGVAAEEFFAVDLDAAFDDEEIGSIVAAADVIVEVVPLVELAEADPSFLMNEQRAVFAVWRNDGGEMIVKLFGLKLLLFVGGLGIELLRLYPDLQEFARFGGGGIIFGVFDAGAGAHYLYFADADGTLIAFTVLV